MKQIFDNVFVASKGKKTFLYTKSAYLGSRHFDEKILKNHGEMREWDPNRSKLGAAVLKHINQVGIRPGNIVLYLGAGHGYTPSYVSDIVGKKGMVFCVEFSARTMHDLLYLCESRDNMAPILGDANKPENYSSLVPKQVDVIFQDVAQKNQVEIFLKNIDKYLKPNGYALLALKSRSFDVTKKPKDVFREALKELEKHVNVVDHKDLYPFERDHALYLCKKR